MLMEPLAWLNESRVKINARGFAKARCVWDLENMKAWMKNWENSI